MVSLHQQTSHKQFYSHWCSKHTATDPIVDDSGPPKKKLSGNHCCFICNPIHHLANACCDCPSLCKGRRYSKLPPTAATSEGAQVHKPLAFWKDTHSSNPDTVHEDDSGRQFFSANFVCAKLLIKGFLQLQPCFFQARQQSLRCMT